MCGDYFGWKILVYLKNSWKHQNENAFKEKMFYLVRAVLDGNRWLCGYLFFFVFLNKC